MFSKHRFLEAKIQRTQVKRKNPQLESFSRFGLEEF